MEDLLHDFLLKYFYDSTEQKRFEDRCRQMSRGGLSPQETEQLLDEIKKEATSISINYSDLESGANKLLAVMQAQDHRDDLFMSTVAEALTYRQMDKAMADDLSLALQAKSLGRKRTPMQRPVANPFECLVTEEEEEPEIVPEDADQDPPIEEPVAEETVPEEPVTEEETEEESSEETKEEVPEETEEE